MKSSWTGMPSWAEKTSRFSNDGALIPLSIRLRKSTEISSSSANCSWLIRLVSRMVFMRPPNFSRNADKQCTCRPNVAYSCVCDHRVRLRVVMRLRVARNSSDSISPLKRSCDWPLFEKFSVEGKTESAPRFLIL